MMVLSTSLQMIIHLILKTHINLGTRSQCFMEMNFCMVINHFKAVGLA